MTHAATMTGQTGLALWDDPVITWDDPVVTWDGAPAIIGPACHSGSPGHAVHHGAPVPPGVRLTAASAVHAGDATLAVHHGEAATATHHGRSTLCA